MNDKPELLGKMIRERRKEKKITQEALAEKVGVSAKQISSYENGHQYPPMDMLFKLCEVLDCDLGYLLGQEDYKEGTLLETCIINTTGLTSESLGTIIAIKKFMHGRYLPSLNKLLSDKSALFSVLDSLNSLEKLEQEKVALDVDLVKKYGEAMVKEAKDRYPDLPINDDTPKIDTKLLEVMDKLGKNIDRARDIDETCIPAARYELFESLITFINKLYPSNSLNISFR